MLAAASLCLLSALVELLLEGSGFFRTVRLALGLEIAWMAVSLAEGFLRALN